MSSSVFWVISHSRCCLVLLAAAASWPADEKSILVWLFSVFVVSNSASLLLFGASLILSSRLPALFCLLLFFSATCAKHSSWQRNLPLIQFKTCHQCDINNISDETLHKQWRTESLMFLNNFCTHRNVCSFLGFTAAGWSEGHISASSLSSSASLLCPPGTFRRWNISQMSPCRRCPGPEQEDGHEETMRSSTTVSSSPGG